MKKTVVEGMEDRNEDPQTEAEIEAVLEDMEKAIKEMEAESEAHGRSFKMEKTV